MHGLAPATSGGSMSYCPKSECPKSTCILWRNIAPGIGTQGDHGVRGSAWWRICVTDSCRLCLATALNVHEFVGSHPVKITTWIDSLRCGPNNWVAGYHSVAPLRAVAYVPLALERVTKYLHARMHGSVDEPAVINLAKECMLTWIEPK